MGDVLEMSLEPGPTSLFVPKGNPTKLDYGRFRPSRANGLGDVDDGSQHSEQINDNTFDKEVGNMAAEVFGQYIGQIYAVRKGVGKGKCPK